MNSFPSRPIDAQRSTHATQAAMQAEFRARVLQRVQEKHGKDYPIPTPVTAPAKFAPPRLDSETQAIANRVSTPSPLATNSTRTPHVETQILTDASTIPEQGGDSTLSRWLADIQDVAKQNGIIDLRAQDILRAQYTGDSILADYLV